MSRTKESIGYAKCSRCGKRITVTSKGRLHRHIDTIGRRCIAYLTAEQKIALGLKG